MLEFLIFILFTWLFIKSLALIFRITWGLAKIVALILFILALPSLIGCFLIAGGLLCLIPLGLMGLAFGILRASL